MKIVHAHPLQSHDALLHSKSHVFYLGPSRLFDHLSDTKKKIKNLSTKKQDHTSKAKGLGTQIKGLKQTIKPK